MATGSSVAGTHQSFEYRPDLDGLRAVAILPVLLFHAGFRSFSGGFVGVDVFFVLSGFFMARIILTELERGSFSFGAFYLRRMRRIFPALFSMIAVSTVAAWFLLMPQEFRYFGDSVQAAALFTSNILFRGESGYFDVAAEMKPLLHTWSLSVEEQFYLIFPVAVFLGYKFARRHILTVVLVVTLLSFGASTWGVAHAPEKTFYLLHFRVWELLTGALVAIAPRPAYAARGSKALAALGLLAILLPVFTYSPDTPFPGPHAAVPCLGTALVIHAHCRGGLIARFLGNPVSVFIGRISYSLYLWHWPTIVFLRYGLGHELTTGWALTAVAMSFALAYVSWKFVEQPARYGGLVSSRGAIVGVSSAAIGSAVVFGSIVNGLQGIPQRLPEEARTLYQATYDESRFSSARCFADTNGEGLTPAQIRRGKLCRVGVETASEPQFLVWGDSHAAAIAPAIDVAARQMGMSGMFVGRASCPPLPNTDFGRPAAVKRCIEHNSAVMSLIEQKKFAFVFMVGYWPKYVHRAGLPGEGVFFDPRVKPSWTDWSAPVKAGLNTTLTKLARQGTKAVLVMDVPEMGYEVPEALARAVVSGRSLDIAPPLDYTKMRQALARRVLEEAAKSSGALVVDPMSVMCDAAKCHVMRKGTVLYRDGDHLSAKGAESLSALFHPVLHIVREGAQSWVSAPRS
ncbi:peptidoglycan/LPS O-acetylase OafA/YrhL [Sinorhizobium terangae]|uniref:Acyltransferase family protein n=1 Tax=Sinorhizobium terangae TaxID=110322 RepID=A0A6N7L5Q8_SINTE|nr:acyltransferase family protein [Sinorhizobium terangae]MBB4189537.1 peptidoglycan/LPS O-acetylase OafA/YrhL [Sinorhizobium terangae]MQX13253.1 acyltransferase family protein [Sinorhizobium terangae]